MMRVDAESLKRAAVEQWTADPCEAHNSAGELGSKSYFEGIRSAREESSPWVAEQLDYEGAAGLDVLDVGCGQGIDLANYAMAGARVTGIDLTPRHVELARAHLAELDLAATVVQGDAEALPFKDASFDRVSSNGVLHHTPDMAAALRQIHRVLRPGGEARVILYNRSSLHYWCNQVLLEGIIGRQLLAERSMAGVLSRNVEFSTIGARPLVRVITPRGIRRELRRAGFQDVGTSVRQLAYQDAFPIPILGKRIRALRDPAVLERIGRVAGWYVIASGRRR